MARVLAGKAATEIQNISRKDAKAAKHRATFTACDLVFSLQLE
jgi:hypothetical protein